MTCLRPNTSLRQRQRWLSHDVPFRRDKPSMAASNVSSRFGRHETTYLASEPESGLETKTYIAKLSRADQWSNRFPHSPRVGSSPAQAWSTNQPRAVHIVSTLLSTFGGNWLCQNRLTARVAGYSVPSTKPPDGRHARRGRLAIPMSLEVSSFSCFVLFLHGAPALSARSRRVTGVQAVWRLSR
jgi:hypothetical protein